MLPPIKPFEASKYWLTAPGQSLLADQQKTTLVVRLGLAWNAMMAQHRFAVSTMEASGILAARDSFAAFTVAAALTEETRLLIAQNYKEVMALASKGEASPELIQKFGQINSGKHPVSAALNLVRNELTFHWDEAPVMKSVREMAEHERVVWLESDALTAGKTVYRLSSDVLVNAVFPESAETKTLPPGERNLAGEARARDGMLSLLDAMVATLALIEHAIGAHLSDTQSEAHSR
jgi:hypothetical protein